MDLQEWLRHRAPQARDVAVLLIAKLHQSEESEQQRVWLAHLRGTSGVRHWLLEHRQWGIPRSGKRYRIDLHFARRGLEAVRLTRLRIDLGILLIVGLSLDPHPHRVLSQLLHGQP